MLLLRSYGSFDYYCVAKIFCPNVEYISALSDFVQTKAFVKRANKTCDELKDSRKYITCYRGTRGRVGE